MANIGDLSNFNFTEPFLKSRLANAHLKMNELPQLSPSPVEDLSLTFVSIPKIPPTKKKIEQKMFPFVIIAFFNESTLPPIRWWIPPECQSVLP
jgi:hypothetical protein